MKNFVWMLFGAAVGGLAGYYLGKKKGLAVADFQIKQMEEYYQRCDEYERKHVEETYDAESDATNTGREQGMLSEKERSSVRSQMGSGKIVDYTKMYARSQNEEDESEEYDVENDESNAGVMVRWAEENKDREPELISDSAIGDLPKGVEQEVLLYHIFDERLTDEDGDVLDVETTIGYELFEELLLPLAGQDVKEPIRFYILNYQLCVLFMVEAHYDSSMDEE